MGRNEAWRAAGINFGPIVVPSFHKRFTQNYNDKTIPILFADDTSILVTSSNKNDFQINRTAAFKFIQRMPKGKTTFHKF